MVELLVLISSWMCWQEKYATQALSLKGKTVTVCFFQKHAANVVLIPNRIMTYQITINDISDSLQSHHVIHQWACMRPWQLLCLSPLLWCFASHSSLHSFIFARCMHLFLWHSSQMPRWCRTLPVSTTWQDSDCLRLSVIFNYVRMPRHVLGSISILSLCGSSG